MMNRDPVSGQTQRRSNTTDEEPDEPKIEKSFTEKEEPLPVGGTDVIEIDDEERADIELAIKRSLEDQTEPVVENKNNHLSDAADSSSDSDGKFQKRIERNRSVLSRI